MRIDWGLMGELELAQRVWRSQSKWHMSEQRIWEEVKVNTCSSWKYDWKCCCQSSRKQEDTRYAVEAGDEIKCQICRTCWLGVFVAGQHPGGSRCTGGSFPCGLWWKEVMSLQQPQLNSISVISLRALHVKVSTRRAFSRHRLQCLQFTAAVQLCTVEQ